MFYINNINSVYYTTIYLVIYFIYYNKNYNDFRYIKYLPAKTCGNFNNGHEF